MRRQDIWGRSMRQVLALALLCAGIIPGHAKIGIVSGYVNLNDSANVYRALYENTPIEPEFKLAPKFAIVGADNKFVFSIGAAMKFTASFDWGNPVRNPQGMGPSNLSIPITSDNHLYQMTAGGSGIYFNIIGFPNTANEIGLFISIGLDNEANNTYKLAAGQIYMRYRDFQVGYATSLYNDRKADAYTIDSHGPCSSGAHTTVGMNWQHYFNRHIRVGVGVEIPKASYTQIVLDDLSSLTNTALNTLTSHQYVPNFPFYVGYDWGSGHVRLSAILRNLHYVDFMTFKGHNVLGNGLKLSGNANVGPVSFFWMGQVGWGAASCFNDNSGKELDLVPDNETPGRLRPTSNWGCIAGVQWNITPKIFATAQYSYLRNYIPEYTLDSTTPYNSQMKYGYTVTGNVVWKISSLFSTGLEYRYAHRHNENDLTLGNNRVYAMLMMNF